MSRKTGRVVSKAWDNIVSKVPAPWKNALAANAAHEANEDYLDAIDTANGVRHTFAEKVADEAGDIVADTLNVATVGTYRKIMNHFDDEESKINYQAMKQAKKSGQVNSETSVNYRASVYVNENVAKNRELPSVDNNKNDDVSKESYVETNV